MSPLELAVLLSATFGVLYLAYRFDERKSHAQLG